MRFAANLGFLWRDLPLAERLAKARSAGFDLVELHDDWTDPRALEECLESGLQCLGINTPHHGPAFGCAADPGKVAAARADLEAAAGAADRLGARAIHVLAGCTRGDAARAAFVGNLRHGLEVWPGILLIEPLSADSVPGYHIEGLDDALGVIDAVGHPRLKLMFDTFHVGAMEGDLVAACRRAGASIGHIQIASVPGRAEPDTGALDILGFLRAVRGMGYRGDVGVEFRATAAAPRLDWLEGWRSALGSVGH